MHGAPNPVIGGLCPPVPRLRRLCWYRLTRVVLVKGPLNGRVCVICNSYCNTFPVGLLRYCRTYKNSTLLQVLFVLLQYLLLRSVYYTKVLMFYSCYLFFIFSLLILRSQNRRMVGSWVCYEQLGVWCSFNIPILDSSLVPLFSG